MTKTSPISSNQIGAKIIPFPRKVPKTGIGCNDDGASQLAYMCIYFTTLVSPAGRDLAKFFLSEGGRHKLADAIRTAPGLQMSALRQFADTL